MQNIYYLLYYLLLILKCNNVSQQVPYRLHAQHVSSLEDLIMEEYI